MSSNDHFISVIIPTFNGGAYLDQALKSISVNERQDIEVIVIDDGSSDDTLKIVDKYSAALYLRSFNREHFGNWVKNTNFGISQARGKFVSFLHQDDCWHRDRIKVLREMTGRFQKADVIFHPSKFIDSYGAELGIWRTPFGTKSREIGKNELLAPLLVQNFISMPAPIIRRELLLNVRPLDERLWFTADWKLWLELAQSGSWLYCGTPLTNFRIHGASQTVRGVCNLKDYQEQHELIGKEFAEIYNQFPNSRKLFKYSVRVNTALASFASNKKRPLVKVIIAGLLLGPVNFYRYLKYSRIFERLRSRIRAQVLIPGAVRK